MAVCGVLPLFNMMLLQLDMDSCLGLSQPQILKPNNLCRVESSLGTVSSCSTMADHEDSAVSHSAAAPDSQSALPHQTSPPPPPPSSLTHSRAQEAASASGASPASADRNVSAALAEGQHASGASQQVHGAEEGEAGLVSGPPKKRAKTSSDDREDSSLASAQTPLSKRQSVDTPPSISLGRSPSGAETGSSSQARDSKPWWLSPPPPPAPAAHATTVSPRDTPAHEDATSLQHAGALSTEQQQERQFFPKQPVYDPDMLSSMESRQDRAAVGMAVPGISSDWSDRPPFRQDASELLFLNRPDPSAMPLASADTGEEPPHHPPHPPPPHPLPLPLPRPASSDHGRGKEPAASDSVGQGARFTESGQRSLPFRHPLAFEGQQQRHSMREAATHASPYAHGGQGQGQGPGLGPGPGPGLIAPVPGPGPGAGAGPGPGPGPGPGHGHGPGPGPGPGPGSFYGKFMGGSPHESLAAPFNPLFNPAHINPSRPTQGIPGPRQLGHMDMVPPALLHHASNEAAMQKLAGAQSGPTFLPRFRPADPARLGFPFAPYDMMQSGQQRPHLGDRVFARPGIGGSPAQGMMQVSQIPVPRPMPGGGGGGAGAGAGAGAGFRDFMPSQYAGHGRPPFQFCSPGMDVAGFQLDRPGSELTSQGQPQQVPIVFEGRDTGRRINLHDFDSYESFTAHLRAMFGSSLPADDTGAAGSAFHPATAIPGYQIAYEDDEGDTLLAGDTSWREFVRLAKRIKIVPLKRRPRPAGTA